jgi:hypothetical protein
MAALLAPCLLLPALTVSGCSSPFPGADHGVPAPAATGGPPAPHTAGTRWDARVAEARVVRAEQLAEAGEHEAALTEALAGLAASRQAVHPAGTARALLLLGRLEEDPARLQEALAFFEGLHDEAGCAAARMALAGQAVRDGRPDAALAWLEPVAAELAVAPDDRSPTARMDAAQAAAGVHHLRAAALRLAGRPEEALALQRQAGLALTLLPDAGMQELRMAVAQQLGDDLRAASDCKAAFEQHARAASLARETGDRRAELSAIAGLSDDLACLGRLRDATDHCQRALSLAQELEDGELAHALAQRGLQWLAVLREPQASVRWERFRAALPEPAPAALP